MKDAEERGEDANFDTTVKKESHPEKESQIKSTAGKVLEFYYEGGIKEYVQHLNKSKTPIYEDILYFEGEKNGVYV